MLCHYAECRVLVVFMLNIVMQKVVIMNVVMPSVVEPVYAFLGAKSSWKHSTIDAYGYLGRKL